jgi:hypothetical protein
MHEEAEWTLIPSASPASGSYGVNLYAQNIVSLVGMDNRFVVLKRPDASASFADFNTFQNTTVIPQNGQPGRVYNSGGGYAQRTGFTAFSRFAIGSVPLALGVELGEFDLHCNDEYVELSFSTLTESNTSHFSIRTSSDGLHFTDTYLIQAAENSAEETFYTAMLNEPRAHYLQLEQYDRDGSHELLKTAYLPDCSSDRSSVSPSPDGLYIQVYLAGDTSSDVMVFNTDGRLLHSGRTKGKENEVYFIDRTLFDNAVYLIRIVNEESEEILRFVNQ